MINSIFSIVAFLTDPCCGSGSTLRACMELNRSSYGFEISKDFCKQANEKMLNYSNSQIMIGEVL